MNSRILHFDVLINLKQKKSHSTCCKNNYFKCLHCCYFNGNELFYTLLHLQWQHLNLKHDISYECACSRLTHSLYLHIFYFTQGQAISTSSSQCGEILLNNFIGFDSAPDKVVDGSVVCVRYRCSSQCQLSVEVVVSTLRKTDLVVFRRKWISRAPWVYRVHRRVLEAQNVTLWSWVFFMMAVNIQWLYLQRGFTVLQIIPLSERPTKSPTECPSWSAQLMRQMTRNRIHQCPWVRSEH